jgi:hypothetical protein
MSGHEAATGPVTARIARDRAACTPADLDAEPPPRSYHRGATTEQPPPSSQRARPEVVQNA